ncbi:hypothetical protein ACFE04_000731 [Oxalis oulophora]
MVVIDESQNPSSMSLFCEEEIFEDEKSFNNGGFEEENLILKKETFLLYEHDLFWEDSELDDLISKQNKTQFTTTTTTDLDYEAGGGGGGFLLDVRREAVDFILKVKAHYGFNGLTLFLAVNYFDRFISCFEFHKDKPWMGQLAAVACLSLAAKVEETQVPLLLDLQVEESKYLFEAKTIQRMELLVLSSLKWKMNPVTPISFIDHIVRRLGLKNPLHWEFMRSCDRVLLAVVADVKIMQHLPSILAAAIMLHVINEFETCNQMEYRNQLLDVLKISRDKVGECYKLLEELLATNGSHKKRKRLSIPASPSCVIDASFSSDCSNDSWAATSSVSSSPEPLFKRRNTKVQQMRMPSLHQMFGTAITSPH